MNNAELRNVALECARGIDCLDWTLSGAKAGFKHRTGIVVVARSKDRFVELMISLARQLEKGMIQAENIKKIK